MPRRPALRIGVCAVLGACASPPPPLDLPAVGLSVDYELAAGGGEAAGAPVAFTIEVLALASVPPGEAVQLAAVVIESESGRPFRGATRLPAGSRWLAGAEAAAWQAARASLQPHELQVRSCAFAVLVPGLATVVQPSSLPLPTVRLVAAADQLSIRLTTTAGDGAECIELVAPLAIEDALLFVPQHAPHVAGHAIALHRTGEAAADAVAAAHTRAQRTAAAPDPVPAVWRLALRAIGAHNRRAALLALTQPAAVTRIVDLVLIADERALIDITNALARVQPNPPELAWQIEHAAWTAMLPRIEREDITPAMHACLRRQFGAIADEPSALRVLFESAEDCPSLGEAVREENVHALADRNPSRRVHGHAWLVANGGAVPAYDPLAPEHQRRTALRALEAPPPAADEERR